MPKYTRNHGVYKRGRYWWGGLMVKGWRIQRSLSTDKSEAIRMLLDLRRTETEKARRGCKNVSWPGFKEEFLRHAQQDMRPKTLNAHKNAIAYLESYFKPETLQQVEPKVIVALQTSMREKNTAGPAGRNKAMICLKAMMHWAEEMEYVPPRSWAAVRLEREEAHSDAYSHEEISQLFYGDTNMHHQLIVLMGSQMGHRPCEMVTQRRPDINLEKNIVRTFSPKTKTWREIPIRPEVSAFLAKYMKQFPAKDGFLLHNKHGGRYSANAIGQAFKKTLKQSGVRPGNPYMLRHSFVTMLKDAGVDHFTAGKLAGHVKPMTTRIYDHIGTARLAAAVSHLRPLKPAKNVVKNVVKKSA